MDANANISAITDTNFEGEVLKADLPVIVDFWAEWCGPCKAIAPIFSELAQKYAGKLKFAKLDVDKNPATPPKFGVRGIPTLILFKDGQMQGSRVGLLNKTDLASFIDENI